MGRWRVLMNINELKIELENNHIDQKRYCLNGGDHWDMCCLENNYGTWCVYYSERGNREQEKKFNNESDACKYFLAWMIEISDKKYGNF